MRMRTRLSIAAICGLLLFPAVSSNAADAKTYQVTGPVLAVTPTTITVQKNDETWEISRNANTKVTGDIKVGAKVTIHYRMVATAVESKPATGKK